MFFIFKSDEVAGLVTEGSDVLDGAVLGEKCIDVLFLDPVCQTPNKQKIPSTHNYGNA